jgi:hypothetical protein
LQTPSLLHGAAGGRRPPLETWRRCGLMRHVAGGRRPPRCGCIMFNCNAFRL